MIQEYQGQYFHCSHMTCKATVVVNQNNPANMRRKEVHHDQDGSNIRDFQIHLLHRTHCIRRLLVHYKLNQQD